MRPIQIIVVLLSCVTGILAQGGAGGAGGIAGLPKGMPGCSNTPAKGPGGGESRQTECSAVHFVIGRGSCEPPGTGALNKLAELVGKEIPGVTSEGIEYPAALNFSNLLGYVSSSSTGATAGKNQITAYSKRCSKSKIVVTGISQVSGDANGAIGSWI